MLGRALVHVYRNAKPWLRQSALRRRRHLFALITILILLSLFPVARYSYRTLNNLVLYDPLWSYAFVNASARAFPPHDPTYMVFKPGGVTHTINMGADMPLQEVRRLPSHCVDDYFAKGVPCHASPDPPLDVVWTWVNGSDRLFQESLGHVVRTTNPRMPATSRANTQFFRYVTHARPVSAHLDQDFVVIMTSFVTPFARCLSSFLAVRRSCTL